MVDIFGEPLNGGRSRENQLPECFFEIISSVLEESLVYQKKEVK